MINEPICPAPPHVPADLVVDFDISNPIGGESDVHLAWKHLQETAESDLVWTPRNGGHWIVVRGSSIRAALGDYEHLSSKLVFLPRERGLAFTGLPITADPPANIRYRALLLPSVSPKRVNALEPMIRAEAVSTIDLFIKHGRCEFVREYAERLPVCVFLMLCDLPLSDAPILKHWADELMRPDGAATMSEVVDKVARYLAPHLEARRHNSADDILSKLTNGVIEGRALTHEEAMSLCITTLLGGLDTVAALLSFVMLFLARNPAHRRLLAADPTLIPKAVDEFIRRFPIGSPARVVVKDFEFASVNLKKDDLVLIPLPLHALDEREFPNPLTVDFTRPVGQTCTFGHGPHVCPGRFLGAAELRITLEEWFRRIPEFDLDPGAHIATMPGQVLAVKNVPLRWDVRPEGS